MVKAREFKYQKEEPGSHVRAGFHWLVTVAYEEVAVSVTRRRISARRTSLATFVTNQEPPPFLVTE